MASFTVGTRLDRLDRLALAILAEGHSMMQAEAPKGQLKTADASLRCVAVMEVGATLLIAANNFFVTRDIMRAVQSKQPSKEGERHWRDMTTVKNNVNRGDPIAKTNRELFDIFSDTSGDARMRLGYDRVIFVTGMHTYMNNYHAEMQILQFMLEYRMKAPRRFIGVSKPCCPECSAVLKDARIRFTESHAKNAHGVRNVLSSGFGHPILIGRGLADRLGTELLSPGGARESPF